MRKNIVVITIIMAPSTLSFTKIEKYNIEEIEV